MTRQSIFSIAVVWMVALFHVSNLRVGGAFQNLWTTVKLLLIGGLIALGIGLLTYGIRAWHARPRMQTASD